MKRPPILLIVLLALSILVGTVGAGIGIYGLSLVGDARDDAAAAQAKADAIIEARDASRRIVCDEFNEQQTRSIDANKAQVREVFRSLTSDDELTAEEQAGLDRLFADHDAVIDGAFPMRDCTEKGIAAYYEEHRP